MIVSIQGFSCIRPNKEIESQPERNAINRPRQRPRSRSRIFSALAAARRRRRKVFIARSFGGRPNKCLSGANMNSIVNRKQTLDEKNVDVSPQPTGLAHLANTIRANENDKAAECATRERDRATAKTERSRRKKNVHNYM